MKRRIHALATERGSVTRSGRAGRDVISVQQPFCQRCRCGSQSRAPHLRPVRLFERVKGRQVQKRQRAAAVQDASRLSERADGALPKIYMPFAKSTMFAGLNSDRFLVNNANLLPDFKCPSLPPHNGRPHDYPAFRNCRKYLRPGQRTGGGTGLYNPAGIGGSRRAIRTTTGARNGGCTSGIRRRWDWPPRSM